MAISIRFHPISIVYTTAIEFEIYKMILCMHKLFIGPDGLLRQCTQPETIMIFSAGLSLLTPVYYFRSD